jgi:hypothetical protein
MAHTITLTTEELTLIEQKRAEKKAQAEALRTSYDHYKAEKIKRHEQGIERTKKDVEDKKKVYEGFFDSLTAVSPLFKLDCKKVNSKETVELFELDSEGCEITMLYDEEGRIKNRVKPKEKVTLDSYFYEIKLSYTGKVPEGHSFHVIATPINSKYSGRAIGHKMQIQGTGINSWDGKGKMVNPKSVVNRLTELSEVAFMRIESRNAADLQQQRIEAAFRNKFGHLNDEGVQISIAQGQFTLTYENGIELKIGAYEHNSEVIFTNSKVTIPYKFDVEKLVEGLKNI